MAGLKFSEPSREVSGEKFPFSQHVCFGIPPGDCEKRWHDTNSRQAAKIVLVRYIFFYLVEENKRFGIQGAAIQ
jgi:hypothetical protein